MWLVRLRIGPALPRALGWKRLKVGPSPTTASWTTSRSARRLLLFSALAMALFSVLAMSTRRLARREREDVQRCRNGQALDFARHFPAFKGRDARTSDRWI